MVKNLENVARLALRFGKHFAARFLSVFLLALLLHSQGSVAIAAVTKPDVSITEQQFKYWLQSLNTEHTSADAASVEFDQVHKMLKVVNLTISYKASGTNGAAASGLIWKTGSLEIENFSSSAGYFSFDSAVLSDVSIGAGDPADTVVAKLILGRSSLPAIGLLNGIIDFKKPASTQVALLKWISAAQIGSISGERLQVGSAINIAQIQTGTLENGVFQNVHSTGNNFRAPLTAASDGSGAEASVQDLLLVKVDLRKFVRVFDPESYAISIAERPWVSFLERLEASGLDIRSQESEFKVAKVIAGPIQSRTFDHDISQQLDAMLSDPEFLRKDQATAISVSKTLTSAFRVSNAELLNLVVLAVKANKNTTSISRVVIEDFEANLIANISVENLNVSDGDGAINLASGELRGLELRSEANSAPSGAASIESTAILQSANLQNLSVKTKILNFDVGRGQVSFAGFAGNLPTSIKSSIEHITFSTASIANAQINSTLTELGYPQVDLSTTLDLNLQETNSELDLENFQITGQDMGSLSIKGVITGIDRGAFRRSTSELLNQVAAANLKYTSIKFENKSIFDRFLSMVAKKNGMTESDFRNMLTVNMTRIFANIDSPDLRSRVIFAVVAFLNDPKNIVFESSLNQEVPISKLLASFSDPNRILGLLNADIKANVAQNN